MYSPESRFERWDSSKWKASKLVLVIVRLFKFATWNGQTKLIEFYFLGSEKRSPGFVVKRGQLRNKLIFLRVVRPWRHEHTKKCLTTTDLYPKKGCQILQLFCCCFYGRFKEYEKQVWQWGTERHAADTLFERSDIYCQYFQEVSYTYWAKNTENRSFSNLFDEVHLFLLKICYTLSEISSI